MSTIENSDYKFNYEVNRDLVYYFDENQVETIYTQPGTNRKTRHHFLGADLSTEKVIKIKTDISGEKIRTNNVALD